MPDATPAPSHARLKQLFPGRSDAEYVSLMKKNNAFMTPAQGLGWRFIPGEQPWFEDPFFQEGAPTATVARYRQQLAQQPAGGAQGGANQPTFAQQLDKAKHMIQVLTSGGGRIAIGTDSGATRRPPSADPPHQLLVSRFVTAASHSASGE